MLPTMTSAVRFAGWLCNFIQTAVMPLTPRSSSRKLTRRIRFSVSRVHGLTTTNASNDRNRKLNGGSATQKSAGNERKETAGQQRHAAGNRPKLNAYDARKSSSNEEERNEDSARNEYGGQRRNATGARPKNACGIQQVNPNPLNHMTDLSRKKTLRLSRQRS